MNRKNFVFRYFWEREHHHVSRNHEIDGVPHSQRSDDDATTTTTTTAHYNNNSFHYNPEFGKMEFYIRYIISIRSIIDILCIIPTAVEYSQPSTSLQLNLKNKLATKLQIKL